VKKVDPRVVFKMASKSVYFNHCGISYSMNFFSCEDYRKQKRTQMTLNQQMKEISKWNTPLISCAAQVQEQ
jgi:hypothetical protein